MVREVQEKDLSELLELYLHLHEAYRGNGYATECLNYAKALAEKANCFKMMLLTGSKKETTLKFYERAGYNSSDKTAFIKWLG